MKHEFGISLKEKPHDEGLLRAEITDLYDMLSGVDAIPMEVQGEYSSAMGFINLTDAEILDYGYNAGSPVYEFVKEILDDMRNETPSGEYVFEYHGNEIRIYLSR